MFYMVCFFLEKWFPRVLFQIIFVFDVWFVVFVCFLRVPFVVVAFGVVFTRIFFIITRSFFVVVGFCVLFVLSGPLVEGKRLNRWLPQEVQ